MTGNIMTSILMYVLCFKLIMHSFKPIFVVELERVRAETMLIKFHIPNV